jgi:hypothetical protein
LSGKSGCFLKNQIEHRECSFSKERKTLEDRVAHVDAQVQMQGAVPSRVPHPSQKNGVAALASNPDRKKI